jgi:hypothetical protein
MLFLDYRSYKMPPSLVDDHCEPVIVDHFSDDDLEYFSLRDLYARSSARLQVEPVDAVTIQLASEPGDHHQVMAINTNQCYLGCMTFAPDSAPNVICSSLRRFA